MGNTIDAIIDTLSVLVEIQKEREKQAKILMATIDDIWKKIVHLEKQVAKIREILGP